MQCGWVQYSLSTWRTFHGTFTPGPAIDQWHTFLSHLVPHHQLVSPPASSFGLCAPALSKPKAQTLSQGSSDGLYGKRWGEERITDPWQTNWLQAPPCIIVSGRTLGIRKRLITPSALVESLQVLECHGFEQWVCRCQLNKWCAITHQRLWALQWPVLGDAHKVPLPCPKHWPLRALTAATTCRLL